MSEDTDLKSTVIKENLTKDSIVEEQTKERLYTLKADNKGLMEASGLLQTVTPRKYFDGDEIQEKEIIVLETKHSYMIVSNGTNQQNRLLEGYFKTGNKSCVLSGAVKEVYCNTK